MDKHSVVYVEADGDWAGLYVDGQCVHQYHTVPLDVLWEHLAPYCHGVSFSEKWLDREQEGVLRRTGHLPQTIEELDAWRTDG